MKEYQYAFLMAGIYIAPYKPDWVNLAVGVFFLVCGFYFLNRNK